MKQLPFLFAVLALATFMGCRDSAQNTDPDHHGDHGLKGGHRHEHKAPHGGTVVILGPEEYHLEIVRDAGAGTLTAYVLDGEMEKFLRLPIGFFTVKTQVDGNERPLRFEATGSNATGEKPGDTSMFIAQADWLKTHASFEAVLESLEIRGRTYRDVRFAFPAGNETNPKSRP
jgi:hypothetical protein